MERWVEVCGRVSRAKCKRDKGDVLLQEAADPGGSCTLRGVVGNMASCKKKGACHSGLPLTPVDLDQQPYDEKWIQGNLAEQVNSMRLARLGALAVGCQVSGAHMWAQGHMSALQPTYSNSTRRAGTPGQI